MRAAYSLIIALLMLLIVPAMEGTAAAGENPVVVLSEDVDELMLGNQLLLLEDPSASLDFDQAVQSLEQQGFTWDAPGFPVFGFTDSAIWGRVLIGNAFESPQTWLISLEFPSIDQFDLYFRDETGAWRSKTSGDMQPFESRDVSHHNIKLSFPVFPGQEQSLYFRIQTHGSMQLPLYLQSMDGLYTSSGQEQILTGGYFGILLVIAMYSAFMWVSTRDRSYLYFSLFILFGGLYSFSIHGFAYQFLWPGSPGWANISVLFFVGLASGFGILFIREFTHTAEFGGWVDRMLIVIATICFTYGLSILLLPYLWVSRALVPVAFLMLISVSITAWWGFRQGSREGGFFALSWAVLCAGILAELIQRLGVNIPPGMSYYSVQAGTIAAIMILAMGMSDKIKILIEQFQAVHGEMLQANQQKINALKRADDVKEEFIANVSHELRTPLTGIIGLSEILLEKRKDILNDNDKETLTMIKVSGQRLSNLVNDVIDYSAIRSGRLELNKKTIDLKKVCNLVYKMTKPLIGSKPIRLEERYPALPVMVSGDEDRLQQVLFNLVSNAVKFTYKGSITIGIDILDIDARVSVTDTGIGISEDDQKKIFNRFYQVDSAESRQEGGTGLGLAISQKLVELHGTEIILHSRLGEGSVFYFDLPVVSRSASGLPEQEPPRKLIADGMDEATLLQQTPVIQERRASAEDAHAERHLPARSVSGQGRSILVVDDEYLNLRIVEEHLSADYQLDTALSGHEALEKIREEPPDLVILDLMMPVMTGFELCRKIREQYRLDELPVIILTAKNRVEDLVKGLSVGANDYITKPFSKEELKVRVNKQFELLELQEVKMENQRLNWQLDKYRDNEARLREQETRLAMMLDISSDAMLCVDESGVLLYINRKAESLFDISGESYQGQALNVLSAALGTAGTPLPPGVHFPFEEALISAEEETRYHPCEILQADGEPGKAMQFCILPLGGDQEIYVLLFSELNGIGQQQDGGLDGQPLPQVIAELNRNVERTQRISDFLANITPETLSKHKHLFADLKEMDRIIQNLSSSVDTDTDSDQQYREALVKLMQDCHYYWQKVTGETIIDLAEKSRVWSVSIDNGRLRTRSMNRYLSLEKLPSNPRWRQVARTAYFVLSKVSHDEEAKSALEKSVARLQEIVESKALN